MRDIKLYTDKLQGTCDMTNQTISDTRKFETNSIYQPWKSKLNTIPSMVFLGPNKTDIG